MGENADKAPIHEAMRRRVRRGATRLDGGVARQVRAFVAGERDADGFFGGRGNRRDAYYTVFGMMAAEALGIRRKRLRWREGEWEGLDFVHTVAWSRLREWHAPFWRQGRTRNALRRETADYYATRTDAAFPQGDRRSPYAQFLYASRLQELGAHYRPEALRHDAGNLTATVAAVLLECAPPNGAECLRSFQSLEGGFANRRPEALRHAEPDLLSTALALFALDVLGERPRHSPEAFIGNCLTEHGGFAATDATTDTVADVEYTAYALLAIGCL